MRLQTLLLPAVVFALASSLHAAAPAQAPATPAQSAPPPAQIRLEMRLTRTEKAASADAVTAANGNGGTVPAIATPTLTTLDRGTATVSVTNKDLSYSISASPSLEQADRSDSPVQLLWNVRLSGRSLPGGTDSVTTTGATRIAPKVGNETVLTELPVRDSKTGDVSVFRLSVQVSISRTTSPAP